MIALYVASSAGPAGWPGRPAGAAAHDPGPNSLRHPRAEGWLADAGPARGEVPLQDVGFVDAVRTAASAQLIFDASQL